VTQNALFLLPALRRARDLIDRDYPLPASGRANGPPVTEREGAMIAAVAPSTPNEDVPLDVERLIFFSDAVIAIAITLLVIQLDVPAVLRTDADLRDALVAILPNLFSFFLSFVVIGIWWASHHRLLRVVERSSAALVVLNFVLLGAIAFLPFASRVLGNHGTLPTAVILYSLTNLVAASALLAMREVAERQDLLQSGTDMAEFQRRTGYTLATASVFAVSIPIALVSPSLAQLAWNLVFALVLVREWRTWRRRRETGAPAGD
jgi:uncharacterized membrane protein